MLHIPKNEHENKHILFHSNKKQIQDINYVKPIKISNKLHHE